jgi:hypothetical protein
VLKITPFALANIAEVTHTLLEVIDRHMMDYLNLCIDKSQPILWEIFMMVYRTAQRHPVSEFLLPSRLLHARIIYLLRFQIKLLQDSLRLWTSCRMTEGGWQICGADTLDTIISNDTSSPFFGKAPFTPMILLQIGRIVLDKIIKPLRKRLLSHLQKLILENKSSNWFTIFLTTFIILHNYSMACAHDCRFVKHRNLKVCRDPMTVCSKFLH